MYIYVPYGHIDHTYTLSKGATEDDTLTATYQDSVTSTNTNLRVVQQLLMDYKKHGYPLGDIYVLSVFETLRYVSGINILKIREMVEIEAGITPPQHGYLIARETVQAFPI